MDPGVLENRTWVGSVLAVQPVWVAEPARVVTWAVDRLTLRMAPEVNT